MASAYQATTVDGTVVEIWVGRGGETALGALWRRLGWLQGRTPARRPVAFDVLSADDPDGAVEVLVDGVPRRSPSH